MTQNYYPHDTLNFTDSHRGEREAIRICNAALDEFDAIKMSSFSLDIAKDIVVKAIRQLGLLCQKHLDGFGYVAMK